MLFEGRAGEGQAQGAPGALQQRRPGLLLDPRQGAGDARLAHAIDVRNLGDGHAIRHMLEPSQCLGVHNP